MKIIERSLFGSLAVTQRLLRREQLVEALRDQELAARRGPRPRLGEVLVARGRLKPQQVLGVLAAQGKQIVRCPVCQTYYNARDLGVGARINCPCCNAVFAPAMPEPAAPHTGRQSAIRSRVGSTVYALPVDGSGVRRRALGSTRFALAVPGPGSSTTRAQKVGSGVTRRLAPCPALRRTTPIERESRKLAQTAAIFLAVGFLVAGAAWALHGPSVRNTGHVFGESSRETTRAVQHGPEQALAAVVQTRAAASLSIQELPAQEFSEAAAPEVAAWPLLWAEEEGGPRAQEIGNHVPEHFAPELTEPVGAAAPKEVEWIAAQREAAARVLFTKLVGDVRDPGSRLDFAGARKVLAEAEPDLAGTGQAPAYQNVRTTLQRLEGLVDRVVRCAKSGELNGFGLHVKEIQGVIVDATPQGLVVESGPARARLAWSSLDTATLAKVFQKATNPACADEVADLAVLHLYLGNLKKAGKLLDRAEALGAVVDSPRELAIAIGEANSSPVGNVPPAERARLLEEEAATRQALKGMGWEISRGCWTVNPDGTLVGTPEAGLNLISLWREVTRFSRLEVEVRGEGDAVGFSFGKGQRFMARPIDAWQKLTLQADQSGRLELRVDGEVRASLEMPKNVTADQLPGCVYLRGLGARVEFRNFSLDGQSVQPPAIPGFEQIYGDSKITAQDSAGR